MSDASFTRRGFLAGSGALITTAFMHKVDRHVSRLEEPLLLPAPQATIDLHYTPIPDEPGFNLSSGELEFMPPPAPTWRENYASMGRQFCKLSDYRRLYHERDMLPHELDETMPARSWAVIWEACASPSARVYCALSELDLGPDLTGSRDTDASIAFFGIGGNPSSCERWVDAADLRAVSLLQARLIELKQPYRLVRGEL